MRFFYNNAVYLFWGLIKIYSFFNKKAKLFIDVRKNQKFISKDNVVLFHCSSLGEYESIKHFIRLFKEKNKNSSIFLSAFSPSINQNNIDSNYIDYFFYFPIDSIKNVKKIISQVNPKKIFFVRKELWFNFIFEISKRKIPVYLISAKFKKKDFVFKSNWMITHLKMFNSIFTIDYESSNVLKLNNLKNYIYSGDTRFDSISNNKKGNIRLNKIRDYCCNNDIIVFGSIYKEDIKFIGDFILNNDSFKYLIAFHENCKKNIDLIIEKYGGTKLSDKSSKKSDIMLIDEFGILKYIYKFANIVYIGGGFNNGIHNILEPIFFGNPVIFGPKYENFSEAKEAIKMGIAKSISNKYEFEESVKKFKNFDRTKSKKYFESNLGASKRIMFEIDKEKI